MQGKNMSTGLSGLLGSWGTETAPLGMPADKQHRVKVGDFVVVKSNATGFHSLYRVSAARNNKVIRVVDPGDFDDFLAGSPVQQLYDSAFTKIYRTDPQMHTILEQYADNYSQQHKKTVPYWKNLENTRKALDGMKKSAEDKHYAMKGSSKMGAATASDFSPRKSGKGGMEGGGVTMKPGAGTSRTVSLADQVAQAKAEADEFKGASPSRIASLMQRGRNRLRSGPTAQKGGKPTRVNIRMGKGR